MLMINLKSITNLIGVNIFIIAFLFNVQKVCAAPLSYGIEINFENKKINIDDTTFDKFPKTSIRTGTPWTGKENFQGVKISTILEHFGITGKNIRIEALNEYWVEIPYEDIIKYNIILANKMNGKTLPPRSFGPYWMLYPIDDHPEELKKPLYNSRLIWQVRSIYVN